MNKEQQEFVGKIKQGAIDSWTKRKILPSLVGAQAILESGWGKSELATKANNLFGVKANESWSGEVYIVPTKEFIDNEWIVIEAPFRKYKDWNESVYDHSEFFVESDFRKNNYKHLIGETDYKKAVQSILKPIATYGYATDPDYANKVINIIEQYKLYEWDNEILGKDTSEKETNDISEDKNKGDNIMTKIGSTHAGHGGDRSNARWSDAGAVNGSLQEATLAREINSKIIQATGLTNTTDNAGRDANAILANTVRNINNAPSGWQISNHLNAFGDSSANGVEVLYGSVEDKPMAEKVSKAIADALGLRNRGAKDGTWLYIARNTNWDKKVLLIEWGFITNSNDMKQLRANMDKGVNAMLQALGSSSTVPKPAPSKPAPAKPAPAKTYKINSRTKNHPFVGQSVSILGHATHYATGQSINKAVVSGKKYKVIEKGSREGDNKPAYLLEGIMSWVLEQDISKPASKPTPASGTYTVKKGDTLWGIANAHKMTVSDLKARNGLKSDLINVGQVLKVNGGSRPRYTVKKGDTLWGIANAHKTTVQNIKNWNSLKSDLINVGQVLIVG